MTNGKIARDALNSPQGGLYQSHKIHAKITLFNNIKIGQTWQTVL